MREEYLDEQIISEFDFTIKIKSDEKNDFLHIKREISKIEYHFFSPRQKSFQKEIEFSNTPYLLLKHNFDKHFRFLGENKAYLTNYSEKEGSFIMDFTILIIQSAITYGGIRRTIDYFVGDLEFFFSRNLPNDFKTKVNYKERRKFKKSKVNNNAIFNSILQQTERKASLNRIIISITLFLVILGVTYFIINNNDTEFVTKSELESSIEKVNNRSLDNAKIEVYINKKVKDSLK